MAKYIDKDEVVDMLRRWGQEAAETSIAEADAFEAVAYELQYFPEADVEPVVHCKDCMYSRPAGKDCEDMVVCTALSKDYLYMMKSDFCSYGTFKEAPIGSDTD